MSATCQIQYLIYLPLGCLAMITHSLVNQGIAESLLKVIALFPVKCSPKLAMPRNIPKTTLAQVLFHVFITPINFSQKLTIEIVHTNSLERQKREKAEREKVRVLENLKEQAVTLQEMFALFVLNRILEFENKFFKAEAENDIGENYEKETNRRTKIAT